ncbi:hypothetical protein [Leptolyngbya sp. AN10]|uniref:hypothetical protein n=1 Tax=Leptolyngbya sp. AN10 TaxID=3423365 RepID=UPI003D317384
MGEHNSDQISAQTTIDLNCVGEQNALFTRRVEAPFVGADDGIAVLHNAIVLAERPLGSRIDVPLTPTC